MRGTCRLLVSPAGSGGSSRSLTPAPAVTPGLCPLPSTVGREGSGAVLAGRPARHTAHLRQRSDGRDSSLFLCCLDSVAAGAAHGEREAGEDYQLPPEATSTHGGVGQDQSQGPEAGYCPQEPGLCLGQWQGARGTGDLRRVLFFHTIQFFRSQEGHSNLKKKTPLYSFLYAKQNPKVSLIIQLNKVN